MEDMPVMEIWISGTIAQVKAAAASGLAAAVATNPTIVADWTRGGRTLESVVSEAADGLNVPLYVQLHGPDLDGYLVEFEALRRISDLIQPKLVATEAGITAAGMLARAGFKPLVTAVCSASQAVLAAAAGASFVAPYLGRITDAGADGIGLVRDIAQLLSSHGSATRIVTASVRSPQQAEAALLAGAHAVVVFDDVFKQMFASALTQASIDGFERDWEQIALHAQSAQQPTF